LALALLAAGAALAAFPRWTVDDAFIIYRYGENLARHGELNWNVGEDPVEGYTGVALVLALAGGIKLGASPIVLAKLIGIAAYVLTAWALAGLMRAAGVGPAFRSGTVGLYLLSPMVWTHAWSGLETHLFGLGVTASAWGYVAALAAPPAKRGRSETALAPALLATSLTRPEGAALAAALALGLAWGRARTDGKGLARWAGTFAWAYVLPGAAYFGWRASYYGQWLPNTFYAKRYVGWANPTSLLYLLDFFYTYLTFPALAVGALWLATPRGGRPGGGSDEGSPPTKGLRPGVVLVPFVVFLIVVLTQYARSVLVMKFSFRFMAPFYPLFLAGLGWAADRSWSRAGVVLGSAKPRARAGIAVALGLLAIQLAILAAQVPKEFDYARTYLQILEDEHLKAGRDLAERLPAGAWIAVCPDVGAIAYFSRLKTVDLGLLNDETLTRPGLALADKVDYFFSRELAAAIFTSHAADRIDYFDLPDAIAADPRFAQRFELHRLYRTTRPRIRQRTYLLVYLPRSAETPP